MKKLVGLFALIAFGVNVFAQQPGAPDKEQPASKVQKTEQQKMKDGVRFKAGKAWLVKSGETTALDKEMLMINGAKVTPQGTVIMKDGSKTKLEEGDFIALDGTIERAIPVKATDRTKAYPEKDANK